MLGPPAAPRRLINTLGDKVNFTICVCMFSLGNTTKTLDVATQAHKHHRWQSQLYDSGFVRFPQEIQQKHKIVKLQGQLYDLLLYVFLMKYNKKT